MPPWRWASHRSSYAAMWPRSHTRGLMIGECTRSRSALLSEATSSSVPRRARSSSARNSAGLGALAVVGVGARDVAMIVKPLLYELAEAAAHLQLLPRRRTD